VEINEIITRLYNDKEVDECIQKVCHARGIRWGLREDFKQELFLILMKRKDNIFLAEKKGKTKYYVVRVILNLASMKRDIFHKTYLQPKTEIKFDIDGEYSGEETDREERLINEVNNLDKHFGTFFHRELLNAIVRHGSMCETARVLQINKSIISRTVKTIRTHLKDKI
jgi:hypothetical protein